MNWLKKNLGWIVVLVLALWPLFDIFNQITFNFETNEYEFILFDDYEYPADIAEKLGVDLIPGIKYVSQVTGNWAIRFFIAVLMCTPLRILFGWNCGLYLRQALGIATGFYALLHFSLFVFSEGFLAIFSKVELVSGFLALGIIVSLMITSNRRSMKLLKSGWKKLHRFVYLAAAFVLLHVVLLKDNWVLYVCLLAFVFLVRFQPVRNRIESIRMKR